MAWEHPAKVLTAGDAAARVCSVCGDPVDRTGGQLRHAGEAAPRRVLPARADAAAVRRAEAVAARALDGILWEPHLTSADRARVVVEALYAAGLIARRPRPARTVA